MIFIHLVFWIFDFSEPVWCGRVADRHNLDVETERRKNAEVVVVRTKDQLSRSEAQYQMWVLYGIRLK